MEQFDAKQQLAGLLDWMRAQMKACGGKTAVIGISGGKDSSVVAALSVAAYGRENVVGVLMPDGVQPDIDYSNGLVEHLGIRSYTFNIQGGTKGLLDEMDRLGIEASRQTTVNLPSRMRMVTLYAIAQSVDCGIVINTSNLSEDWVGYCTIYGDSAGAFSPLGMYTTEEVIALGAELGASRALPHQAAVRRPDGQDRRGQPRLHLSCGERVCSPRRGRPCHQGADRPQAQNFALQVPDAAGLSERPAHRSSRGNGLLQSQ